LQYECFGNCSSLTEIEIPNSVTYINQLVFNNCTSLTSITLGENISTIYNDFLSNTAFYNNAENWENSVLYIDKYLIDASADINGSYEIKNGTALIARAAFSKCTALKGITVPSGVKAIPRSCFEDCTALESAIIGKDVEIVESLAFSGCTSLTKVLIPEGVKTLEGFIFRNCTALLRLDIPDSVEKIGASLLSGCSSITTLKLPFVGASADSESDTYLGYLFGGYSKNDNKNKVPASLKNVILSGNCEKIGAWAFYQCAGIERVDMPSVSGEIIAYTFENCTSLKRVTISNKVTNIVSRAFQNATNLSDVYYIGSESDFVKLTVDTYNTSFEAAKKHFNHKISSMAGDINCDGSLDGFDLVELTKAILTNGTDYENDFDCDGKISILDFIRLKKTIA